MLKALVKFFLWDKLLLLYFHIVLSHVGSKIILYLWPCLFLFSYWASTFILTLLPFFLIMIGSEVSVARVILQFFLLLGWGSASEKSETQNLSFWNGLTCWRVGKANQAHDVGDNGWRTTVTGSACSEIFIYKDDIIPNPRVWEVERDLGQLSPRAGIFSIYVLQMTILHVFMIVGFQ